MSAWKLQCYFCPETVSSVQLNKDYYLLHLVAVHNVQQHADKVLEWMLAQKGAGQSVCLPVPVSTSVAVSRRRKVASHQRIKSSSVLNVQGLTVKQRNNNIVRLIKVSPEETAVSEWANGVEHGCRICRKLGKPFSAVTKHGLLIHLQKDHKVTGLTEQDFNNRTHKMRSSRLQCKECGASMQRHSVSLDIHLRKHGLNITTYWKKHIRPQLMPYKLPAGAGSSSNISKPGPGVWGESFFNGSSESEQVGVRSRTGLIGTYHGGVIKKVGDEKGSVKSCEVIVIESDENELTDFNDKAARLKKPSIASIVNGENGSIVSVIDADTDPLEMEQSKINEPMCIIASSCSI